MRSRAVIRSTLVATTLLAPLPAMADIAELHWLAGCWAAEGQDAGSVEHWTAPAGGTMFGVNRTVRNGRTVFFEYLRIVDEDDGSVVLVASPSGQETARFRLTQSGPREVTFENPEHDFPQRISYRLTAADRLVGRIDGTVDGEKRSVEFPMTRTACGGQ